MKINDLCKTLAVAALTAAGTTGTSALAVSWQDGYGMGSGMMEGYGNGWMGGYGGISLPILLVVAVAGLVTWIVMQKRK